MQIGFPLYHFQSQVLECLFKLCRVKTEGEGMTKIMAVEASVECKRDFRNALAQGLYTP